MNGNWNFPNPIRFGPGRIIELPEACKELGITRPLLVSDSILADLPIVEKALQIVREAGMNCGLFSQIQGNPVGENVEKGVEFLRAGGFDGVIAFGGGSALDVAKAIALMGGQVRPLWDFEDIGDNWTRVNEAGILPVVAVPTTSGTGSEVGRCSVIVNESAHRKVIIFHPKMMPGRVIADPELTIGLPAKITAAVGMDALSHNLEAFCVDSFHPMADGIALEGMRRIKESLLQAVEEPTNIAARSDMMVGSMMGATAFQKGLGAMHALSHPVSVALGAHHGLTNAIFMPYVLYRNQSVLKEKMTLLSRFLGLQTVGFSGVLDWVLELRADLGIPHTTQSLGFKLEHDQALAPQAHTDPCASGNPIPLDVSDYAELYQMAREGIMNS